MNINRYIKKSIKFFTYLGFFVVFFYSCSVFAVINTIGDMANNIVQSFQSIGKLMIGTSYMAGVGFSIASMFKFKQHRDNPTQIPVGTPIALLAIGAMLIFLPGLIAPLGYTLFGDDISNLNDIAGGFKGGGATSMPGGQL